MKYTNFPDIFSKLSVEMPPKRIDINKHTIKLVDVKQSTYNRYTA